MYRDKNPHYRVMNKVIKAMSPIPDNQGGSSYAALRAAE